MKHSSRIAVIICFTGIFITSASAESVYKWVDAEGKVHYGDRPEAPAAQTLRVAPAPPVDTASQQRLEALKRQGKDNEQKKEMAAAAAAANAANAGPSQEEMEKHCAASKQNLAQLEGAGALLFENDKDGNRRLLPLEERSKTTETMRKEVERWCQ